MLTWVQKILTFLLLTILLLRAVWMLAAHSPLLALVAWLVWFPGAKRRIIRRRSQRTGSSFKRIAAALRGLVRSIPVASRGRGSPVHTLEAPPQGRP